MTYTWVGDLSTDLDKVRFYIGDETSGSGPQPNDGNFTDEELGGLIGLVDWEHAVADAFDVLAAQWSHYSDITVGPRRESFSQIAEAYRKRAEMWRKDHNIYEAVNVAGVIRVDGYSDDVASDDTDATSAYTKTKVYWDTPL